MRHGFTLIELMIVIAIIAIIAAIAIPNLLESRITANESAAAASLKSGILAGQTQFQSGAYSDVDGDGRGEYAMDHLWLAGATVAAPLVGQTSKSLTLVPPTFNVVEGTAVGAYKYQIDTDITAIAATATTTTADNCSNAESFFGVYAIPATAGDGRRAFGMGVSGVVYATKQTYTPANLLVMTNVSGGVVAANTGAFAAAANTAILASDPRNTNPAGFAANAAPFQK